RAMMDQMRRKKAVVYDPFRDFLSAGSDYRQRKIARPTRFNRAPNGFAQEKKEIKGAYNVFSWGSSRSAIYNLVSRTLEGWDSKRITAFIDKVFNLLVLYPWLRVEIPEINIERVGDLPPRLIRPVGVEPLDLEIDGYFGSFATAKGQSLAKLAPQLPIGSL